MRKRYHAVSLLLWLLMLATAAQAEIDLKDFEGKSRRIADYAGNGKWLVVMIWAHDCMVCNKEVHQYIKFHNDHKDKNAVVLGVSIDGQGKKDQAVAFIKRHHVEFPNVIGESAHVQDLYAGLTEDTAFGTPSFMVYNPEGKLVGAQVGAIPPELIEKFIQNESAAGAQPQKSTD